MLIKGNRIFRKEEVEGSKIAKLGPVILLQQGGRKFFSVWSLYLFCNGNSSYYLATKNPWKVEKKLPRSFFLTLSSFVIFVVVSKTLDFFLAISALSIFVSYCWGEKRLFYLLLVGIIFSIIVFIFFETILGLRFPPGIITNIYYS